MSNSVGGMPARGIVIALLFSLVFWTCLGGSPLALQGCPVIELAPEKLNQVSCRKQLEETDTGMHVGIYIFNSLSEATSQLAVSRDFRTRCLSLDPSAHNGQTHFLNPRSLV
jgi:hypothetical protein